MSPWLWLAVAYGALAVGTVLTLVLVCIRRGRDSTSPRTPRQTLGEMAHPKPLAWLLLCAVGWPWFLPLWLADEKGWLR